MRSWGPVYLLLAVCAILCGQAQFEQSEQLSYEQRVVRLEEQLAARSEDVKQALQDIQSLKTELKDVRDQAKSAADTSKSNADLLGQITWLGRLILGGIGVLTGAVLQQFITRYLVQRKPEAVKT
jgi:small-conductance mechanosensitive channel